MTDPHEKKRATMAAKIAAETGRGVDDWAQLAEDAGISGFMNIVGWLKAEHGFRHFQARRIAEAHRDR